MTVQLAIDDIALVGVDLSVIEPYRSDNDLSFSFSPGYRWELIDETHEVIWGVFRSLFRGIREASDNPSITIEMRHVVIVGRSDERVFEVIDDRTREELERVVLPLVTAYLYRDLNDLLIKAGYPTIPHRALSAATQFRLMPDRDKKNGGARSKRRTTKSHKRG